jgi:hypothetical protein
VIFQLRLNLNTRTVHRFSSSQAGVHIFSVVFNEGYESLWTNPLIGPNGTSLYRCGALFVDGGSHGDRMANGDDPNCEILAVNK